MADWLGMGLQSPLIGFDSRRRLKLLLVPTHLRIRLDCLPSCVAVKSREVGDGWEMSLYIFTSTALGAYLVLMPRYRVGADGPGT